MIAPSTWLAADARWSAAGGRSLLALGTNVPVAERRAIVGEVVDAAVAELEQLAALPGFQPTQLELQLPVIHLAAAGGLRGGAPAWGPADTAAFERLLGEQFTFLSRFAADVAAGRVSSGFLATRAGLYAYAARGLAEETLRQAQHRSGAREERRVLGFADHCVDCIAYAGLGWQPIGTLPRTTDSRCRVRCRCHFEYR